MRHNCRKRTVITSCVSLLLAAGIAAWSQAAYGQQSPGAKPAQPPARKQRPGPTGRAQRPAAKRPGAKAEPRPDPRQEKAKKIIEEAIKKLEARSSYECKVRHLVRMFGFRFTGEGRLLVAPNYKRRFELTVNMTKGTAGTLLEVSDGSQHYRSVSILDTQWIDRLDLARIRRILNAPEFDKDARRSVTRQLGFHGVVPVLEGLLETQQFESIESGTLDGVPVHVLHSRWKPGVLDGRLVQGRPLDSSNLPPFIPSRCTVWIGKENGWLYKVEMRGAGLQPQPAQPPQKKPAAKSGTATTPAAGSSEPEALFVVEFLDPQFDKDVPQSAFRFEPPKEVEIRDITEVLAQQLEAVLTEVRRRRMREEQRKLIEAAPGAKRPQGKKGAGGRPGPALPKLPAAKPRLPGAKPP